MRIKHKAAQYWPEEQEIKDRVFHVLDYTGERDGALEEVDHKCRVLAGMIGRLLDHEAEAGRMTAPEVARIIGERHWGVAFETATFVDNATRTDSFGDGNCWAHHPRDEN